MCICGTFHLPSLAGGYSCACTKADRVGITSKVDKILGARVNIVGQQNV